MARTEDCLSEWPRTGNSRWAAVWVGEPEGTLRIGGFAVKRCGTHSLLRGRGPGLGPQTLCEALRQVPPLSPGHRRCLSALRPCRRGQAAIHGWKSEVPGAPCWARGLPHGHLQEEGKALSKGQGTRSPSRIAKWMLFPW